MNDQDKKTLEVMTYALTFRTPALDNIGKQMFTVFTQQGLPPDMFFDNYKKLDIEQLTRYEMICVLSSYLTHFVEHRRRSGIEPKRLDNIRRQNRELIGSFIRRGEIQIY